MALNLAEAVENPVLRRLRADQMALGMVLRISRSGDIARIARAAESTISCSSTYSMRSTRWRRSAISPKPHSVAASRRLCGCEAAATPTSRSCWIAVSPALYVRTSIHRTMHGRSCRPASSRRFGRRSVTSGYPFFDYRPGPAAGGDQPAECQHAGCLHDRIAGRSGELRGDRGGGWR